MSNEDGTIHVVYNGEIYNFVELRAQLIARGHIFRTHCDTEVVVHAYEEWGDDAVTRFNGMFAYAIWDERRQRLLLVRDRMGVKPLVYQQRGNRLAFASEIKSLLQDPDFKRELNTDVLMQYLSFFAIPEPQSLLHGIARLPAGHMLIFENGRSRIKQYWDVSLEEGAERGEPQWLEELEALLEDSVRIRLISDVPLGAFLSGGIDSSLVVAMMARAGGHVTTTSVQFLPGYSEAQPARAAARAFNTEHHERNFTREAALAQLERMVWHHDEPSQSLIQSYLVSGVAREFVTVALSGLGADELFSGYPSHVAAQALHMAGRVPRPLRHTLRRALSIAGNGNAGRLKRLLAAADLPAEETFASRYLHVTEPGDRAAVLSPALRASVDDQGATRYLRELFATAHATDFRAGLLYVDQKAYLANELLRTNDSMSMAHSLEVRTPYMDYRMVELAARMPMSMKLRGFTTKHALRVLARRLLPTQIARRPKSGFSVPLREWLGADTEVMVRDRLSPDTVRRRGYFDAGYVTRMLDDHYTRRADRSQWILALLTLEMWHRQVLDAAPAVTFKPAQQTAPAVSIIIVNWNTADVTRNCLQSIRDHARVSDYEVIVIDNASSDNSVAMIREQFPEVQLIENQENVGFGRANNQGMRVARGRNFLLLNSDTLLTDDAVPRLLEFMTANPDVGIAGPRLLFGDGRLQHSTYRFPSLGLAMLEDFGLYKFLSRRKQGDVLLSGYWPHDEARPVDWVSGAVMMVRREVFEQAGGFDERTFMYGEDMEWCMRARDFGWKTAYTPDQQIVHLEHKSAEKKFGDSRIDLCHQRLYEFYARRHGNPAMITLLAIKTAGAFIRTCYFGARAAQHTRARDYFAAQARFHNRALKYHLRVIGRRELAHR